MGEWQIDFDWWKDAKGYRLMAAPFDPDAESVIVHPLGIRVGIGPERHRIVRRGGKLESYRPLHRFGALLYREFSKIDRPSAALHFVERFGPLTGAGLDPTQGDDVDIVLVHAEAMRELISFVTQDRKTQIIEAQIPVAGRPIMASLTAAFILDKQTRRPRLHISAGSLLDALWLSACTAIQNGNLRICKFCSDLFETGPGTERRGDRLFCSEEHKIRWHSLARSNGSTPRRKNA